MSNRRNATRAQRVWRDVRKLDNAELLRRYPLQTSLHGGEVFVTHPAETKITVRDIQTRRNRVIVFVDIVWPKPERADGYTPITYHKTWRYV